MLRLINQLWKFHLGNDGKTSIRFDFPVLVLNLLLVKTTSSQMSSGRSMSNIKKKFSTIIVLFSGDSTVEHPISPIDLLQNDQIRPRHVTDRYFQESTNRSGLFGRFSMNYGEPQFSPQTDCLPIGVALSYDESILLSCDVHRNSESVRLFDVQTGRLKHKINSHQVKPTQRFIESFSICFLRI